MQITPEWKPESMDNSKPQDIILIKSYQCNDTQRMRITWVALLADVRKHTLPPPSPASQVKANPSARKSAFGIVAACPKHTEHTCFSKGRRQPLWATIKERFSSENKQVTQRQQQFFWLICLQENGEEGSNMESRVQAVLVRRLQQRSSIVAILADLQEVMSKVNSQPTAHHRRIHCSSLERRPVPSLRITPNNILPTKTSLSKNKC